MPQKEEVSIPHRIFLNEVVIMLGFFSYDARVSIPHRIFLNSFC